MIVTGARAGELIDPQGCVIENPMLYVLQYRPLVAVALVWSLLCGVAVPLSAQSIRVIPGVFLRPSPAVHPRWGRSQFIPDISGIRFGGDAPIVPDERVYPRCRIPSCAENCARFTTVVKADEDQVVRAAWHEVFGFDVWYPYYKEKEIEGWVRKRFQIKIFRLKGELEFNSKGFTYTFKSNFG